MGAGQQVHERREEHHTQLTVPVSCPVHAQAPRGHHEVGLVVHQRLKQLRHLGGIVLAVGIEGDHVLGPQGNTEVIADT